jgi:drug/metabolite transporter superfamily protein YnfA
MLNNLLILILAASLEVGGDAAIRHGLIRSTWQWVVLGAVVLAIYGLVVNTNREVDFGRLMGIYIVVFFVVSQVVSAVVFGARPTPALVLGGLLIVAGGAVIQLGALFSP